MKRCAFLGVGLTVLVTSAPPAWAADEGPERLCVYYFGNSPTGNTMPTFHPALGKSAGREWVMDRSQGAGWQRADGLDFGYTDRGRTRMQVCRRSLEAGGRIAVPQGNWSGGLVLIPPDAAPAADTRPDG